MLVRRRHLLSTVEATTERVLLLQNGIPGSSISSFLVGAFTGNVALLNRVEEREELVDI